MNRKYAYWLSKQQATSLRRQLEDQGRQIRSARKVVCSPLSRKTDIGMVPPETWSDSKICHRQLSWYVASRHAGQYLVVSSEPLAEHGLADQIVLRICPSFRPPALPQKNELPALIQSRSYRRHKPQKWDDLASLDPAELKRWMRTMGIRGMDFQELFVYHCANHANFLDPSYYIRENGHIVPYSIAPTKYVCSACLELFNIIGERFRKKRVVPCPGAVIFAGLPVNKYLEVETRTQESP